MAPTVSILIPTYNRAEELERCLNSLITQTGDPENIEIIISDDSDSLGQIQKYEQNPTKIIHLKGPQKGPAANRNYAAKIAKGEWLIFLDDDCIPCYNWLTNYLQAFESKDALVFEGKTMADRDKKRYDEVAPINLQGNKLWSCNFAIKKSLFEELGGFDEGFPFSTMEDIEFKDRVKNKTKSQFLPEASVIHPWRKRIAFKNFSGRLKSQTYYYEKNNSKNTFTFRFDRLKIWLLGIILEFIALSKFSFKGWTCYVEKMAFNFCMIFI
jgi:GT2 family glycosyltransferase